MFLVKVTIMAADGAVIASYNMDHHDAVQRRVLGEQAANALYAGQTVITLPVTPVKAQAARFDPALGHCVFYNTGQPYTNGRAIVYGDSDMGWYEYVLIDSEGLAETRSNLGYGSPEVALRDALTAASGFAHTGEKA